MKDGFSKRETNSTAKSSISQMTEQSRSYEGKQFRCASLDVSKDLRNQSSQENSFVAYLDF